MKEHLAETLKRNLADTFAFSLKLQFYHWNVEGPDFYQYHKLFETIYDEVSGSVDLLAELIRTLDEYAPGTLSRMSQLSAIQEDEIIGTPREMVSKLLEANRNVLGNLYITYKMAEQLGEMGISNAVQDRIQAHNKHTWFLLASGK